jgi:hypothetical protein
MMKNLNISITEEMERRLEADWKKPALDSIPETIGISSDYLAQSSK